MLNKLKNIIKSLKHSNTSEISNVSIIAKSVAFELKYKDLLIGVLEYSKDKNAWNFSYSEEFKSQNKIAPIPSFPSTDKVYEETQLWSFFTSRIPDNVTKLDAKTNLNKNFNLADLLKAYGKKTITNPFDLSVI